MLDVANMVIMVHVVIEVSAMSGPGERIDRHGVYTVAEIAAALRVSTETIRRKITAGELRAIEITRSPRRQYRVLERDLVTWLGPDAARAVFGIGEGIEQVRAALGALDERDRETLLEEARTWARSRALPRETEGRTVTPEDVAARFTRPDDR